MTDKDGKYYAVGLHTENNYKRFNLQSSVIHYQYDAKNPDGVNSDMTLMGAMVLRLLISLLRKEPLPV
jgi:hypothetical protein